MTAATLIPTWVGEELRPFDKLQAHRDGLRHKAVSVFLHAGDRILLQRRALGKYHTPGLWANTCCTHPHWDETPADCAERRLAEELGIRGVTPRAAGQVEYRAEVGRGMIEHEVVDIFIAEVSPDLALAPDPAEVMEVRWMPLPALLRDIAANPERYTPWLRIYLSEHLDMLFGVRPATGAR
ncbi:MAG: isopentenyl-diphosphate Delta-isomerase [Albidovulum sp.]